MQALELEKQVLALPPRQLAAFRARFADAAADMLKENPRQLSTANWAKSLAKEAAALPEKDIAKLIKFLADLDFAAWDKQIEEDSRDGALDYALERARVQRENGETTPL